ncbi:MAG: VOC family protein [Gammaproteobacteria bacterium]|nr:VOC family protein [Gammaproteobacteria bacterium]
MAAVVLTPYLAFHDCAAAIRFFGEVFGNVETQEQYTDDGGRIAHATIRVGGATLFVSDEYPDYGACSPKTLGGSPVALHFHVADADAVAARMVAAGGTTLRQVEDQADGERRGTFLDPFGYRWMIGQSLGTETTDA